MATTNNITGDSLITKAPTDAYRDGWDNIFNKKHELKEVVRIDILTQPVGQEEVVKELTELSQDLGLYITPHIPDICFECENCPVSEDHKMDCSSKAVFDAYILLRDTDKWKDFTESMLNTLEFKVWTEQQDRRYSNMFDKEE